MSLFRATILSLNTAYQGLCLPKTFPSTNTGKTPDTREKIKSKAKLNNAEA